MCPRGKIEIITLLPQNVIQSYPIVTVWTYKLLKPHLHCRFTKKSRFLYLNHKFVISQVDMPLNQQPNITQRFGFNFGTYTCTVTCIISEIILWK
jgi:hypothetical protein